MKPDWTRPSPGKLFGRLVVKIILYLFAGISTFFLSRYLLESVVAMETARILAVLLGIASMFATNKWLEALRTGDN